jgi:capsular polysaccharide transport system permease protein
MQNQTTSPLADLPPLPTGAPRRVKTREFPTFRTIMALILREMSSRYGRSPGGYVWAVLEPVGTILILAIAFSFMLRSPPLGTSFVLFYATGFLPFSLYSTIARATMNAIDYSRPLLMYPAVTWVDAMAGRFLLNALTGVSVSAIVFTGIACLPNMHLSLDLPPILMAHLMTLVIGLGVGALNCAISGLIPIWDMIWNILTRPLMLLSGVLYTFESLPSFARSILWYNPLIHIVGEMRAGFYPMYNSSYVSISYVLLTGLGLLAFGCTLLVRYHRDILHDG